LRSSICVNFLALASGAGLIERVHRVAALWANHARHSTQTLQVLDLKNAERRCKYLQRRFASRKGLIAHPRFDNEKTDGIEDDGYIQASHGAWREALTVAAFRPWRGSRAAIA